MFKTAKSKLLALGAASLVAVNSAMADVTFENSTGIASGSLDVAPFMSIAGIVVIALAAMWAVKKAIALFR